MVGIVARAFEEVLYCDSGVSTSLFHRARRDLLATSGRVWPTGTFELCALASLSNIWPSKLVAHRSGASPPRLVANYYRVHVGTGR